MSAVPHDPQAILDYGWDWATWMAEGDSLTAVETVIQDTSPTPIFVHTEVAIVGTRTVVWLQGGTHNTTAKVTFHVTTAQGRGDNRTISLYVHHR